MSAVATHHSSLSRPSTAVALVAALAVLLVLAAVLVMTFWSGSTATSVPAEVGADVAVPVCEPAAPC